ncbi:hypothetical protein VPH35_120726 [Triticum aestivum]|uniref:F-box/LRR-repeat protein At2g43260-like n=1 Tax=Triticum aestivum TaxID=4565 RepID=UPI001D00587F|nr:F-box/LRR-repeat protein At2g43260-like [Triticum aestivum]
MQGSRSATVFDDLPEWVVVHEILVRLPVKDVLRCHAVRRSWRCGTSTDAFILDHHRHQPSLPIINHGKGISRVVRTFGDDLKIRPVLRHEYDVIVHRATCDGLLILSQQEQSDFYVCNPATRKCASLPHPPRRPHFLVSVAGFYRHHTSGEHRVLWVSYPWSYTLLDGSDVAIESLEYFVLMVGSDQPRSIQWPTVPEQRFIPDNWFYHCRAVHHRGSLHWAMGLNITVFDTIAETFRQMSCPTQLGDMVSLMDMGGALALCRTSSECVTTLDVWVLQDYDAETWGFLYQINLSVMEASLPLDLQIKYVRSMAVMNERELLVQNRRSRILHCDIDGVFLGNVESEEHENHWTLSWHRLQESMISLPLFETQKQEAVNKEPLFSIVL